LLIIFQGVKDAYSWVPGTFNGEGSALLWNDNWQKKPAYNAFIDVLNGKNTTQSR
jgi:endo-1,4-beta-xylanase